MCTNSWKLNNSLLIENWTMTEIKKKIKNFLEFNANENAVLRGRHTALSAYIKIKNTEKSHINNTIIKLRALEKQYQKCI